MDLDLKQKVVTLAQKAGAEFKIAYADATRK